MNETDTSSLRSYLLPRDFEDSRIPVILELQDDSVPSTSTHPFQPQLHYSESLPYQVSLDSQLPSKILDHLSEILSSDTYKDLANSDANLIVRANYLTLRNFCQERRLIVSSRRHDKEPSVTALAEQLANPVGAVYKQLTGETVQSDGQVRTDDGAVKIDRLYTVDEIIKILWEDKAQLVFRGHMESLLSSLRDGRDLFVNKGQTTWEGVEAILAKIAYQAINRDLPNWAVIFGGKEYMILFLYHATDDNGAKRVGIVCSEILSLYHNDGPDAADATTMLPLCSAIVYMLLSSRGDELKKSLKERFGVLIQDRPPALPSGSGVRDAGGRFSMRLKQQSPSVDLQGPGSGFQTLSLVGATMPKSLAASPPCIHLDHLCGCSSTSVVYKSSSARLIVKFSLADRRDRVLSKRSLLAEHQVYEYLKDKGLSFIPKYYGFYTWPGGVALIISDEGRSIADSRSTFKELVWWKRIELFVFLYKLHRLGVVHGDFEPRNVVRKGLRVCIIDFTHSSMNHDCLGWRRCPELKKAWNKLALGATSDTLLSIARFWIFLNLGATRQIMASIIFAVILLYSAMVCVFGYDVLSTAPYAMRFSDPPFPFYRITTWSNFSHHRPISNILSFIRRS